MKLIVVCSPYRGNVLLNTFKAEEYCRFVYRQGHIPFASHLHNTRFLNDNNPKLRKAGIKLGIEMLKKADELWTFGDTLSEGMKQEIAAAKRFNKPIKYLKEEMNSDGKTEITFSSYRRC